MGSRQVVDLDGEDPATDPDPGRDLAVRRPVLVDMLRSGQVKVLAGHWANDEPRFAEAKEAEQLLADLRQYSVEDEQRDDLERIYYVNVDNLPH